MITDDIKEDWWQEFRGGKIGPRPELVEEMMEVAKQPFYLYTLSHFLKYASAFLEKSVDNATIEEITSDELEQRERARAAADTRQAVGNNKLESPIDKIERNLEANKERYSKAADALSRVAANIEYLQKKIANATDEKWRARYEGWLVDSEERRKSIRLHMQRVTEWIEEDERRLAKLHRRYDRIMDTDDAAEDV
jgi:hypothetical protein